MHEMSLVESISDAILEMKEQNEWGGVRKIVLRIGDMRQVIPEIMVFAFRTASVSTPLEGAELVIKAVKLHFKCNDCQREWGEENMAFLCPFCGSFEVKLIHGMELEIESLEVDDTNG